jgi:UDP-glucose 4-epimerase
MKILLTGGTGFIGSYVVKALSDNRHEINILARNPGKIHALHNLPGVTITRGEINDYDTIGKQVKGMDAVIHIGLNYKESAVEMLKGDTLGSVYLFEQAAREGVKQIIYTSSTAVVDFLYMTKEGRGFKGTVDETMKSKPVTFYGATKSATEDYLMAMTYRYPVKANIIRPGYIFGQSVMEGAPSQADTRFKDIVAGVLANEDIELDKNDGTQFLFAGDLAKVYTAILEKDINRETFFALSNRFVTWEEIAGTAIELCHSSGRVILKDTGIPDEPVLFDVNRLTNLIGGTFDNREYIKEHISYWINTLRRVK